MHAMTRLKKGSTQEVTAPNAMALQVKHIHTARERQRPPPKQPWVSPASVAAGYACRREAGAAICSAEAAHTLTLI